MKIRLVAATALGAAVLFAVSCEKSAAVADPAPAPEQQKAQQQAATDAPEIISNFTLADQDGKKHELFGYKDKKAIVIVMQGVGCPIVQKMTPDLKAVQAAYESKGVQFLLLNANIQDQPAAIGKELKEFDLHMVALKDANQKVAKQMGAVRTAETFIVDPKTWRIVYHGPLNDRLTYGREKAKADNDFASQVLDAVLAGQQVPNIRQQADGCIINYV
jgi:peroxiredoxin